MEIEKGLNKEAPSVNRFSFESATQWKTKNILHHKGATLKDDKPSRSTNMIPQCSLFVNPFPDPVYERFPYKSYCTDHLQSGVSICKRELALLKKYFQANPSAFLSWLIYDIDRDFGAFAWEDVPGVKKPHLAVINLMNGHAHLWYLLTHPVCRTEYAHVAPIRYAASIEYTTTVLLGADPGYSGFLTKNPFHPSHRTIQLRSFDQPYTLGDLASNLDLMPIPKKTELVHGLGRNCILFDTVRIWSYKAIRDYWKPGGLRFWNEAVYLYCRQVNQQFITPLHDSEIKSTSRSISHWTWKNITPRGFIEQQSRRGIQSGIVRRQNNESKRKEAKELYQFGMTQREIAERLGVAPSVISYWILS